MEDILYIYSGTLQLEKEGGGGDNRNDMLRKTASCTLLDSDGVTLELIVFYWKVPLYLSRQNDSANELGMLMCQVRFWWSCCLMPRCPLDYITYIQYILYQMSPS